MRTVSRLAAIPTLAALVVGALVIARVSAGSSGVDVRVNTDDSPGSSQNEATIAECGGRLVAAWNDFAGVGFASSVDEGASWSDGGAVPYAQNGGIGGDPVLTADSGCSFYLAFIAYDFTGSYIGVSKSTDGGRTFAPPVRAGVGLGDGLQDKPWIAADATGGPHDGSLYLCWTEFGGSVSPIRFTRSTDGGLTWEPTRTLTAPNRFGQGCQVAVGPAGEVYVAWSDSLPPAVRIRRSDDGGATFAPERAVSDVQSIGHLFDCGGEIRPVKDGNIRVHDLSALAIDPLSGSLYVAWHDRLSDEGDILIARSADRAEHWSSPVQVNDDATNADQFMPAVAVNPDGVVLVTWYDRRLDQANRNMDVFAALSLDGGESFLPNERITDVSFGIKGHTEYSCYMGDYNGVAASASAFHLVWGDNRNLDSSGAAQADVYADRVPAPPAPTPGSSPSPSPTPTPTSTPDGELLHDLAVTNVTVPAEVTVDVSQGAATFPVSMSIENQGDHAEGSPDVPADGAISFLVMLGAPDGCYPRYGIAVTRTIFLVAIDDSDLASGGTAPLEAQVDLTCNDRVLAGEYSVVWLAAAARYEHGDVIALVPEFHDAEPGDNTRLGGTTLRVSSPNVLGDAGCDGTVDAVDALFVLQYAAGMLFKLCYERADVNRDGPIDATDALLILQYAAGLINHLPP